MLLHLPNINSPCFWYLHQQVSSYFIQIHLKESQNFVVKILTEFCNATKQNINHSGHYKTWDHLTLLSESIPDAKKSHLRNLSVRWSDLLWGHNNSRLKDKVIVLWEAKNVIQDLGNMCALFCNKLVGLTCSRIIWWPFSSLPIYQKEDSICEHHAMEFWLVGSMPFRVKRGTCDKIEKLSNRLHLFLFHTK